LEIVTTVKHKTISSFGLIPILIVDVWEHAYYLQYKNERSRFVNEIWKIINFEEVEKRFHKAIV
jgi:Fe-Mn family superoxide dismutase